MELERGYAAMVRHKLKVSEWNWRKNGGGRKYDNFRGIPVCDEKLLEMFGEDRSEGLILGGIEASDNVRAFLRLPPKFRTFQDFKDRDFKIQVEVAAAKERFSKVQEDIMGRLDELERLRERHRVEKLREPEQEGGVVSFCRLKVTDFLSNKRVSMPPRLEEEEEVKVETKKDAAIRALKMYREEGGGRGGGKYSEPH